MNFLIEFRALLMHTIHQQTIDNTKWVSQLETTVTPGAINCISSLDQLCKRILSIRTLCPHHRIPNLSKQKKERKNRIDKCKPTAAHKRPYLSILMPAALSKRSPSHVPFCARHQSIQKTNPSLSASADPIS